MSGLSPYFSPAMHTCSTSFDSNSRGVIINWAALVWLLIQASGCATVELVEHTLDPVEKGYYRNIYLSVDLSDAEELARFSDRFLIALSAYNLQLDITEHPAKIRTSDKSTTAFLNVEELDREIVQGEHHRTYGRRSLTQMRGRKKHNKPVVTLRATLIDAETRHTIFQADYVTQGPWYADSAAVIGTLPGALLDQLERDGLIASRTPPL